jgi:hypothetical protein
MALAVLTTDAAKRYLNFIEMIPSVSLKVGWNWKARSLWGEDVAPKLSFCDKIKTYVAGARRTCSANQKVTDF